MRQRTPGEPLVLDEWRDITLDISTLTLGEASRAEQDSGLSIEEMARGATLRLLAMYVHGLRTYDVPPKWSELSSLGAIAVLSSRSPDISDGPPSPSSGSRSAKRTGSSRRR